MQAVPVTVAPAEPAPPPPMPGPLRQRVLILADPRLRDPWEAALAQQPGALIEAAGEAGAGLQALQDRRFSLVVADPHLPGLDAIQLLHAAHRPQPPVTVIFAATAAPLTVAVDAMRLGAYHFLAGPPRPAELAAVAAQALGERALVDEVAALREFLHAQFGGHHLLSKSPALLAVLDLVRCVAPTNSTVLIEGETGTGKEQVARAIHEASARRHGPFVAVNCAAMPEGLLESELFGHEKGAFTSAVHQRPGRFELAQGGTLFLDEVGDLPGVLQVKLLRVLQERKFERVGGNQPIAVDSRILAATNRSLFRQVRKGAFRSDLYYRLNVVRLELPPLRDRPEDIPLLAAHFAARYTLPGEPPRRLSPEALELLARHPWPGNVRHLENAIARACLTCWAGVIRPEDLPADVRGEPPAPPPAAGPIDLSRPLAACLEDAVREVEIAYLRKALKKAGGNVSRCARLCGLSRRFIHSRIALYGLDPSAFSEP